MIRESHMFVNIKFVYKQVKYDTRKNGSEKDKPTK